MLLQPLELAHGKAQAKLMSAMMRKVATAEIIT